MTNRELSNARMSIGFEEWNRRWHEHPEEFGATWPTDGTYGERCAKYFAALLDELDAAGKLPRGEVKSAE